MSDSDEDIAPRAKLTRDLKAAVKLLNRDEARYLVDAYYQRQEDRIRSAGQQRALSQRTDTGPEHEFSPVPTSLVLDWLHDHDVAMEGQLKLALGHFVKGHMMGEWLTNIVGIGPVMAAGLICHFDIEQAPTVGHFWNYAGLNPGVKWEKGQKRPWNARLKKLCFLIGESFVKVQHREGAQYGVEFARRKALEIAENDDGNYIDQCTGKEYAKGTEAWPWVNGCYPAGTCARMQGLDLNGRSKLLKELRGEPGSGQKMLPPAHIHARARRWVVKLFLSHLHQEWFLKHYGTEAPRPYAIDILKHAHVIHHKPVRKKAS